MKVYVFPNAVEERYSALDALVPDGSQRYVANLGHVADDESGLIYMRARCYEPSTGRLISEDPAMDGKNWFVYCNSDPVNKTDSSGLYWSWSRIANVTIAVLVLLTEILLPWGSSSTYLNRITKWSAPLI